VAGEAFRSHFLARDGRVPEATPETIQTWYAIHVDTMNRSRGGLTAAQILESARQLPPPPPARMIIRPTARPLTPVGDLFNTQGRPTRNVLSREDMRNFMSSVASMISADQRQSGLQQWLDEYEIMYSDFLKSVADPALLLTRLRAFLEEQMPTSSNPRDDFDPREDSVGLIDSAATPVQPFLTTNGTPSPHIWTLEDENDYRQLVLNNPDQTRAQVSFWMKWSINHARDLEKSPNAEIVSSRIRDWVMDNVVLARPREVTRPACSKDPGTSTAPMEH
jgi:hypothetical protein